MYKCRECGGEFARPRVLIEAHGLDTPPYEKHRVCPRCGSGEYANEDDICGEMISCRS